MEFSLIALILGIFTGFTGVTDSPHAIQEPPPVYAVAHMPTPVLYTSDFEGVFGGEDGRTLKLDDYGEVDEVEFVALSGSVFRVLEPIVHGDDVIYRVETAEYPYATERGYYVDSRFVTLADGKPAERVALLPSRETVIANLLKAEGSIYTWGGNYHRGIPELLEWYPPSGKIPRDLARQWGLTGVDCSGLLYEATDGYTPRNTSALVDYGTGVAIAGLSAEQIAEKLEPLDIVAWKWHTIVVLDGGRAIQSKLDYEPDVEGWQGGVRIMPLTDALATVMESRVPADEYVDPVEGAPKIFVARRWYSE